MIYFNIALYSQHITIMIERRQGVWGAAAPQPPEAEKRAAGLGGGSYPQPPEAQNNK